jgi:DNA-binding SARP family transcriptional activator
VSRLLKERTFDPGTAGETLNVRCLGEFRFAGLDGWQSAPAAKRGRELLQFLVLRPNQPVSRARLCDALWPGGDLQSLANRMHIAASGARTYLREVLGGFDALRCTSEGYGWHPIIRLQSDLASFTRLYDEGSGAALREAMSLYRGELFEGDDSDWLQPPRFKFATMYASAVERLAWAAFEDGCYERALQYGLELLAIDRAHEGASRLVMRSFGAVGRRGRVLAEYQALRAYLRLHLSVEPMPETTAVLQKIMAGDDTAGAPPTRAAR